MSQKEFEPIILLVNIVYKGKVIASQCKLSTDELFSLREGAFNMEERLKGAAVSAVKEAFENEIVKNRNA